MKRGTNIVAVLAVVVVVALVVSLLLHRRQGPPQPIPAAPSAPRTVIATASLTAAEPAGSQLGARLRADDEVADEVVFLFVAALRWRCTPAQARDLPRMAVVAGLPVLSAGGGTDDADAATRRAVSTVVRELSARAPCERPLDVRIGTYAVRVAPAAYAAAFPDSYFDPTLAIPPEEYDGLALAARAADPCNRVAYTVLPLDAPRAWQCAGLRASARKRIRGLCRAQNPADAASNIHNTLQNLPSTCQ